MVHPLKVALACVILQACVTNREIAAWRILVGYDEVNPPRAHLERVYLASRVSHAGLASS